MKVKLNIPERLVLMQILPKENNFLTLKAIRNFQEIIGIKEEDFKKYEILEKPDGKVSWNEKGAKKFQDFEVGEKIEEIIIGSLKKLNEDKKLEQKHFTLYEKFIEKV